MLIIEILFFAAIAGFFLFRLFQVLGKSNEEDVQAAKHLRVVKNDEEARPAPEVDAPVIQGPAAAVLDEIARAEPGFDPHGFLDGAKAAYEMIVEAFAQGHKDQLGMLLASAKLERWLGAIGEREAKGHRQISDIVRLVRAEIVSANISEKTARIGVKFEVDLASGLTDADGAVIQGDPSRVARVNEVWTFMRKLRDPNPNWLLESVRKAD